MPQFTVELNPDEAQQIIDAAAAEGTTPDALIQRWTRQRLAHERERAAGTARPMSPRARREAEGESGAMPR